MTPFLFLTLPFFPLHLLWIPCSKGPLLLRSAWSFCPCAFSACIVTILLCLWGKYDLPISLEPFSFVGWFRCFEIPFVTLIIFFLEQNGLAFPSSALVWIRIRFCGYSWCVYFSCLLCNFILMLIAMTQWIISSEYLASIAYPGQHTSTVQRLAATNWECIAVCLEQTSLRGKCANPRTELWEYPGVTFW